jgi:CRISPR-associated endonuclease Cas1/CRISPR-associated protein Cas4
VTSDPAELLPARILNEHVYCPRLAYLMWADKEFRDNQATAEGTAAHQRVDRPRGRLPEPSSAAVDRPKTVSSVWLGSEQLGLTAKIDLVETDGRTAVPIEYKHGHPTAGDHVLHEPERVQLAAQALLLREHGYAVEHAEVWFAGSRTRHRVELSEELEERTRTAAHAARQNARSLTAPDPLVDDPRCDHCVLVGLCLPDEHRVLRGGDGPAPRRLVAGASPAQPLYLTEPRSRLSKKGGRLVLKVEGQEVASVRLIDVAHVAVFGNATVGSAALRALFDAGVPVLWLSHGGWLAGHAGPVAASSVRLRMAQHRAAMVGEAAIPAQMVAAKIRNCRTLLRRALGADAAKTLDQLRKLAEQAGGEQDLRALLGLEGTAARLYFEQFSSLLRSPSSAASLPFNFTERNRRPPRDPINALLSFAYAMLVKDATTALLTAGLDPYVGLYHQPRFGRPSLALDLAEEFRPLIADSAVVRMVNNGEVRHQDFVVTPAGAALTADGRRKAVAGYERRMSEELRHPTFSYRANYRRTLEIQARLLAATLIGELDAYRPLTTR